MLEDFIVYDDTTASTGEYAKVKVLLSEGHTPLTVDTSTRTKIATVYDAIKEVVLYKNEKYGNSALEPIGIFAKGDAQNSICIRLDDKLQRIKNGQELRKNDVADMLGYLGLLCVSNDWLDFTEFMD